MARPGVVHRDPRRTLQPGAQHLATFRQEVVLLIDQQAHDLPLGDAHPERQQQTDQPLHRHLSLVILHQHEAAQFRPEMAADARGQRRDDGFTRRRQPALATVAYHPRGEHQVLHLIRLIALELRALRSRHPKHLRLHGDPRGHLATAVAVAPLAMRLRPGGVFHAARLDHRPALEPLEASNLIALRRDRPLQLSYLAQQFHHQSFQLGV